MSTAKTSLVDTNARAGEIFVKEYFYRVYDSSRHEVFRFYREDSTLIWNGNAKKGLQTLRDFFQQLPPSTHNIYSIDCQPIADGTDAPKASNIFVTVVGTVTYAKEDPRHFHQTFILAQEAGKGTYYIVNDCFRLTTGPVSA